MMELIYRHLAQKGLGCCRGCESRQSEAILVLLVLPGGASGIMAKVRKVGREATTPRERAERDGERGLSALDIDMGMGQN